MIEKDRTCEGSTQGWWPDKALYFFQTQGVTEESYYPYKAGDQNCSGRLTGWDKHLTKITGFSRIVGINFIKDYVSTKGPIEDEVGLYEI